MRSSLLTRPNFNFKLLCASLFFFFESPQVEGPRSHPFSNCLLSISFNSQWRLTGPYPYHLCNLGNCAQIAQIEFQQCPVRAKRQSTTSKKDL